MHPSILFSTAGTVVIACIYIYLYAAYRERCMALWSACWFLMLLRYTIFDAKVIAWQTSESGIIAYQVLISAAAALFLFGTYAFVDKRPSQTLQRVIYGLVLCNPPLTYTAGSLAVKLALPIALCCLIGMYAGLLFLRLPNEYGVGKYITACAFAVWCISLFILPYAVNIAWIAQLGYASGGIFRLAIALGALLTYFGKRRFELIQRERSYRFLAENSADAIYFYRVSDKRGLKYVSPAITEITGYTPQEFYQNWRLFRQLLHKPDRLLYKTYCKNIAEYAKQPLALHLTRKDGKNICVEQTLSLQYDAAGNLTSLQGVLRDVTQRQYTKELAAKVNRAALTSTLAATVAHDVGNALTVINAYLQIFLTRTTSPADLEKYTTMKQAADHADRIIKQFLQSAATASAYERFALHDFLQDNSLLLHATLTRFRSHLELETRKVPFIFADKTAILQILNNLIKNAAEAMPTGGRILVRTTLENDRVILSVIDQGPGIPPELLRKLGTPFLTTKESGTGLSLMSCYYLARRNHARIEVKTGSHGTEFRLCFPATTEAQQTALPENQTNNRDVAL